ncbi:MAG: hypothetical protein JOZ82_05700, partial [Marmoricola sp.]|nr:hypothetical protein [Marmoricola sp.]
MASSRRSPLWTAATTLLLALSLLSGCSNSHQAEGTQGTGHQLGAAQARVLEQRVLDQRARAIRQHDLGLFLRHVNHADRGLMARQRRYFRNLVQLPLAVFRYQVGTTQWVGQSAPAAWGHDVRIPQVTLQLQLRGYDAVPVERTVGFAFSLDGGRARIVSDRSAGGAPLLLGTPQPWDLTAITVHQSGGVLGIFDRTTASTAGTLVATVNQGIGQLEHRLPFTWSNHVVVYSVGNTAVLRSFTDVPGGSIEHLGALTFPTYAGATGHSPVASMRML